MTQQDEADVLVAFGTRLYMLRTDRDLSQKDLSERAGIDRVSISAYERGTQNPGLVAVSKLARALGINVRDFFLLG